MKKKTNECTSNSSIVECELFDKQNTNDLFVSELTESPIRQQIVCVEMWSIGAACITCLVSGLIGLEDNSRSALALSVDSFLDILAYMVIVWRYSQRRTSSLSNLSPDELRRKDRQVMICMTCLFLFSAGWLELKSICALRAKLRPEGNVTFVAIGLLQSAVFSSLAMYKFRLATRMASPNVLISSGINTMITALASYFMSLSMSIYLYNEAAWYLDSLFGMFAGVFIFSYALKVIFMDICATWTPSEEEENDDRSIKKAILSFN